MTRQKSTEDEVAKYVEEQKKLCVPGNSFLYDNFLKKWERYKEKKLNDAHFNSQFKDPKNRDSRIFEINLGCYLLDNFCNVTSSNHGPDFKIQHEGKTVWVEAVLPAKSIDGKLRSIENEQSTVVMAAPTNEIKFNLSSAIKSKCDKFEKYISDGTVNREDALVIAIGTSAKHCGPALSTTGPSSYPICFELAYEIQGLCLSKDTDNTVSCAGIYAEKIEHHEEGRAPRKQNLFKTQYYSRISALLCAYSGIDQFSQLSITHNELATVPLPRSCFNNMCQYP